MYCKNCGKEIHDDAVMCVHCGVSTGKSMTGANNSDEPANTGLVVISVLIPLVGLILGPVNISNGKKHAGNIYLWTGIIAWLIEIIVSGIILGVCLS